MAPEEADQAQQWAGMDGATAWHLIDRHADNWNEVGELMNAWLRANIGIERKQRDELLALVKRYRMETPLGNQPHMIAHIADRAIEEAEKAPSNMKLTGGREGAGSERGA